jgi:hypothetical protein
LRARWGVRSLEVAAAGPPAVAIVAVVALVVVMEMCLR